MSPETSTQKTMIAAQAAELENLHGQGYLVVRTDGYTRCEGIFHGRQADRIRVSKLLDASVTFRGVVYDEHTDIGQRVVPVTVRAFRVDPDGVRVELQAVGPWWEYVGR